MKRKEVVDLHDEVVTDISSYTSYLTNIYICMHACTSPFATEERSGAARLCILIMIDSSLSLSLSLHTRYWLLVKLYIYLSLKQGTVYELLTSR